MLVVDEFQDDDTDDGSSPEQPETPHEGDKEGSGKLARWFKGLFKGKEKGASRTSSGNNSAANSRVSSSTLRVPASPGSGLAQASPEAGASYSHSKSTTLPSPGAVSKQSSKVSPGAPHVEVAHPHVKLLAEEGLPANRAKSVSLKSELQRLRNSPMQHSKSFTELSNKAKVCYDIWKSLKQLNVWTYTYTIREACPSTAHVHVVAFPDSVAKRCVNTMRCVLTSL